MSKIIQKRVIVWFISIIMSIFVSGCGGGGSSGSPILGQGVNTAALTVTSTDPLANATNVALNKSVSAIFSETLNPTTVTTSSFHLVTTSTNVAVAGTLSYSGNTMLFNPDVAFAPSTQYTATITTDVKDLAGNALAVAKVWNFTTGLAPDTAAPTVTSTDPLANATNVALNKSVSAIFSETLNPTTVTTSSFHLVTTSTNVAVAGTLSYSGNTMLFNPDVAFAPSTQYTATITTDVKDLAGNALAVAKVWNFTTGLAPDTAAPTVTSTDPLANATNVALNKSVSAIFSETLNPTTVTTSSFHLVTTSTNVAVAGTLSYSGNTMLFNPDVAFAPSTQYTATITTDVKDLAGNALAVAKVWNFTTGLAPDTAAPTVTSTDPLANATNVALNKSVSAIFSETLNPTTVTTSSFHLVTTSTNVAVAGTLSYSGNTMLFNPDVAFAPSTQYTATITTDVKDLAGNALAVAKVWNFTTAAILPPTVVATSPANGDINVSTSLKNITAEFSVPMDLATLNTGSFTLSKGNPAVLETGGQVTYVNKVAELAIPTVTNLDENTTYTATITTVATSTDGTALTNDYVWIFTTGLTPDTIPPEVTSTSPIDGDTNVSITKLITVTFSEAMMPSSITATIPATFSVKETLAPSVSIAGVVTYSVINKIAAFKPTLDLTANTNYTATITTISKDLAGNQMLNDYNWTFMTAAPILPPELVALGLSSTYGIAATAGITNTPTLPRTQVDGNVVLNPTAVCNGVPVDGAGGIGLCGGLAKVPLINGIVVSKTPPYPDTTTAQNVTDDLRAAYLSITPANMPGGTAIAAGTTLGAPTGNALVVGDNLFYHGVYTSITSILITGDLTLDAQGDANATFVFQSASTIGTMPNARILLINGAKASNVYWQAGSAATLQTNTIWNGNILSYSDITMVNGASSCGRLFAGAFTAGAFVFDSNRVSVPGNVSAPTGCE